jgi:hypothetical protein
LAEICCSGSGLPIYPLPVAFSRTDLREELPFGKAGKIAFALGLYISFFNVLSALSDNRALDPYIRVIWMTMPGLWEWPLSM